MTLQYETPTTGATVTAGAGVDNLVIDAAALAALTIDFPASPSDNDEFCITSNLGITTTTLVATGSAIKGGVAAAFLRLGGSHTWVYAATPNAWFSKA